MKTKLFTLLLAVAASVGTLFASNTQVNGIWYDFNSRSKTATVTYRGSSYNDYSNEYTGTVVIPASVTYNYVTYSVTSIGREAFYDCHGLASVVFPNSITRIGDYAFELCTGLTSVTIGNSVATIGNYAFSSCSGLTSVYISDIAAWCAISFGGSNANPLYYAHNLYLNNELVTELIIPNSVTSIGNYAFYSFSGLSSVTIGNSVATIGNYAFYSCSGLSSLTIGNSVATIGNYAFYKCSGLTSVTIPNSVTSIGFYAFQGCSGLTSVTIPDSVTSIGNNAFYNVPNIVYSGSATGSPWGARSVNGYVDGYLVYSDNTKTTLLACSSSAEGEIVIPNSVTSIGDQAFRDCSGLTSVTIGNSVTSIGSNAFYNCSGITSVTIEAETPPTLGSGAFSGTNNYPIDVPCGTLDAYISAWPLYSPQIKYRPFEYSISGNVNIEEWGSLIIPKNICEGDSITAIPNYGYHFAQWSDGNKDNPRTFTLTQDTTFTAAFAKNPVITYLYDDIKGTIIGDTITPTGVAADSIMFEAKPNYGYHFTQWTDGNTDNPRTIWLCQDTTFTAAFAKNVYSITYEVDSIRGSISGVKESEYLDTITIEAVSNYGYHFTQWSDGNPDNPRTFVLTKDTTFSAVLDKNTYSITKIADHGHISGSNYADFLDEVTLTVNPSYGYHFTQWSDGNADTPRTFVLTQDTTFTAEFAPNKYMVSVTCDEERGTIEGESGEFDYLTELTYIATPNYGYHFNQWDIADTENIPEDIDDENNLLWDYTNKAPSRNPDNGLYYANRVSIDGDYGIKMNSVGYAYFTKAAIAGTLEITFYTRYSGESSALKVETWEGASASATKPTNLTLIATTEEAPARNITTVSIHLTAAQNNIFIEQLTPYEIVLQKIQFRKDKYPPTDITSDTLTFKVEKDTVIHALFAKNVYKITKIADEAHGVIEGLSQAEYLDSITLTATPNYGYHFTRWSDGNTNNPRIFVLTQDTTFTAEFAVDRTGTCGDNNALTWSYDSIINTLTISGGGALNSNYTFGLEAPTEMEQLIISEGVTAIGADAFANMSTLRFLQLPASLKTIGEKAFENDIDLTYIYNYRERPGLLSTTAFDGVNKFDCILYVLANSIDMYKSAGSNWKDFYFILPLGTEAVPISEDTVIVTPTDNTVVITWPVVDSAATYTIEITKDDSVFCTLIFNANGQLTGIAFAPSRNGMRKAPAALMTTNGLQFTVTGLSSNTQYGYSVVTKDENDALIASYSGEFTTTGEDEPTGIVNTAIELITTKILRDGQIFILRGEKVYTLQGQEVR